MILLGYVKQMQADDTTILAPTKDKMIHFLGH